MSFVKLYDADMTVGYISTEGMWFFGIDHTGADHYVVRACADSGKISDGYAVSPRISNIADAHLFMDSIIEKLKRF